jgi:4-alpha-glucanotransferase
VLVSFGTHDLPSLVGWWKAIDIAARRRLKLYRDPSLGQIESAQRANDRLALILALEKEGLLDEDFPSEAEITESQAEALAEAVYAFLDRTPSMLLMVQFEDVLALLLQMNLPGTTTQHPNWRVRYPTTVQAMLSDPRLERIAQRLSDRAAGRTDEARRSCV